MQETWVWALGREDALEEETATHSSILAWEIPTEEPSLASYTPWGHKELTMTERWLSDSRRTTTSTIPVWDGCLGISRREEQKEKNREERWASRREEGKRKSWNSTRLVRHRVPQERPLYEFSYSEREYELTSSSNYYQMTEYDIA